MVILSALCIVLNIFIFRKILEREDERIFVLLFAFVCVVQFSLLLIHFVNVELIIMEAFNYSLIFLIVGVIASAMLGYMYNFLIKSLN